MPRDRRSPVMPHDDGLIIAQGVDQTRDVGTQLDDVVGFDAFGPVAASVATLVRNGDFEARLYDRAQLRVDSELIAPALVVEEHATSYLAAGWKGRLKTSGSLIFERI